MKVVVLTPATKTKVTVIAKDNARYDELATFRAVRILKSLCCFKRLDTNAEKLRNHFAQFIDNDDRLRVSEVSDWRHGERTVRRTSWHNRHAPYHRIAVMPASNRSATRSVFVLRWQSSCARS